MRSAVRNRLRNAAMGWTSVAAAIYTTMAGKANATARRRRYTWRRRMIDLHGGKFTATPLERYYAPTCQRCHVVTENYFLPKRERPRMGAAISDFGALRPRSAPSKIFNTATETQTARSFGFHKSFLPDLRAGACPEQSRRVVDFHTYGRPQVHARLGMTEALELTTDYWQLPHSNRIFSPLTTECLWNLASFLS